MVQVSFFEPFIILKSVSFQAGLKPFSLLLLLVELLKFYVFILYEGGLLLII